jgi:lipoate---protein ligase
VGAKRQEIPTVRLRVIDLGLVSALRSQAAWYGIAKRLGRSDDPVLTLCEPAEPYVCIGLNQDSGLELDRDFCAANGIGILRRRLGGGAVLLDSRQLIFHFIVPEHVAPRRPEQIYPHFIEPVLRTYRDFGIDARYRPLNDIHVDGRKIGGTAAAFIGEAAILGGMFLFDFDGAVMARCLRVPSEKFRDKLCAGLEDYVTSMRRLLGEAPRAARSRRPLSPTPEPVSALPRRPLPRAPTKRRRSRPKNGTSSIPNGSAGSAANWCRPGSNWRPGFT